MTMHDGDQQWFLVIRNHDTGSTEVQAFSDSDRAVACYNQTEDTYRSRTRGPAPEVEVVLLMADSVEDLERGYPHYFKQGSRIERQDSLLERFYEAKLESASRRHLADA